MADTTDIRAKAQAAAAAGDRMAARKAYVELARAEAVNKAVQSEVIEALLVLQEFTSAYEIATAALTRFPDSPAINLTAARLLLAMERPAEASDVFKRLCELKPDLTAAWENWGVIAMMAGRPADAHIAYKGATARQPDVAALWNGRADAALLCGETDDAEAAWRRSLSLNARQAVTAGRLGRLLMQKDALEEAAHWLRQSVACDPALAPAHINLAMVYLRLNNPAEGLAAADAAVRAAPERAEAHMARGQAFLGLGRNDAAAAAFERALTFDETDTEALIGLVTAHVRRDRLKDAAAVTDRYLALRPDDAEALHMRRTWARDRVTSSPEGYVRQLFDTLAGHFENHLQGELSYNTPEEAAALLAERYPVRDRFRALCDVGCGTGLMAKALAPRYAIKEQVGIDLAPKMLEQARAKGFYTELIAGEAVATLASMERQFDLITAMDVLIYIGDGAPFLREASKRLVSGGVVAVSLETSDDIADVRLELTSRFAHNKTHFIALAAAHEFVCVKDQDVTIRQEHGAGARGCILIFERI